MKNLLQIFFHKRMLIIFLMGFSSGIPLALTGATLQAWMATEKVDLTVIGIFSLVGIPYTLKFLWSPLMDRFSFPFLGRRRGWMFVSQSLLVLTILLMGMTNPVTETFQMALLALVVAFFSASQDIVVDAYRAEALEKEELGAGAAIYIFGYRLAMLTSGALALILADHLPWQSVYMIMALCMVVGLLASWFAEERKVNANEVPKTLTDAVVKPFVEYFKRSGAFEMLLFIFLFKLGDVMTSALSTPFMIELGFTKTDIGAVNKGFGLVSTILGALLGGALMTKLGQKKSLWIFGGLQAVSNLCFAVLAHMGHHYPAMVTAIAVENLSGGMGTAAYAAFIMSLCDKRFTATQYALLSSLMALTRVFAAAPTGYLVKAVGWEPYFVICTFAAIPGLLFLLRYDKWTQPE